MKTTETNWIEEELTLAEFADKFLHLNDLKTPTTIDTSDLDLEISSETIEGEAVWKPIVAFLVKPEVQTYYTDGLLKGTDEHKIVENGKEIYLKDHSDFKEVIGDMQVVDLTVEDTHTYHANGRLNHNTKFTPGGNAMKFYASLRLRLLGKKLLVEKEKATGEEVAIGAEVTVRIDKNKLGPPGRKVDFKLNFTSGIEEIEEWLGYLVNLGYFARGGAWYTVGDNFPITAVRGKKLQRPDFEEFLEDPKVYDACVAIIREGFIRTIELDSKKVIVASPEDI